MGKVGRYTAKPELGPEETNFGEVGKEESNYGKPGNGGHARTKKHRGQ